MKRKRKKTGKKLNKRIAREIRALYREGNLTQAEIAEIYGVERESVNRIINNRTYKEKGGSVDD